MTRFEPEAINVKGKKSRAMARGSLVASSAIVPLARLASARRRWLFVVEYPKSGGNWLCSMLAAYFDLSFPREYLAPPLLPAVVKGHWSASQLPSSDVYLHRDGRDVAVSLFFHYRTRVPKMSPRKRTRRTLDQQLGDRWWEEDPAEMLDKFLPIVFSEDCPVGQSWQAHCADWTGRPDPPVLVSYERLIEDPISELRRTVVALGDEQPNQRRLELAVERHDFALVAGRPRGVEDNSSFFRAGTPGGWKEHFSSERLAEFDAAAGSIARRLGY